MSQRQEKNRRINLKIQYISAFETWLSSEPSILHFLKRRRWKKERPAVPDFVDVKAIPDKCAPPNGITIKPDGKNELDPCVYELTEIHRNVTVEVSRCLVCGYVDISWKRQEDTEDEFLEPYI